MPRQVTCLRDNWKFTRQKQDDAFAMTCADEGWESVRVPHDWAIAGPFDIEHDIDRKVRPGQADIEESVRVISGRTGGLPHIGEGWYRRSVDIPAESEGRVFRLEFDGVMSRAEVYCNGERVGTWPYGYSSFAFDITAFVKPGGANVIAVYANNPPKSSRWYPGAGIYRSVRLVELAPNHIDHWGVCVTTPELTDTEGTALIRTTLRRTGSEAATLRTTIRDPQGRDVVTEETAAGSGESPTVEQSLTVPSPERWSLETPAQYAAETAVVMDGEVVDSLVTRFGFRTLRFDPDHGFFLNEKPVKMKGVCQHHDLGPLGAAVNTAALKRQLVILKEMGCNAIRTSHNPPAPELPALASEMGLLVIDEAFDEWKAVKCENGYNTLWEEWAEKDMRALIRRDRNHPAVIMWSTGNEIHEQELEGGDKVAQFLTDICHDEDPTRPVTNGMNSPDKAIASGFAGAIDVPGWNYGPHLYARTHTLIPDKAIYGSETASTVSSRGEYYFPAVDEVHLKRDTLQVSSYDLSFPGWATSPDVEFRAQDECPFIMGEFVWTGFDYLGEPTPYNEEWPSRSSYFGIVDLAGIPKDRFYLYQSQWSEQKVLHLMPHWTWPGHEGKPVPVQCYSNYPVVELFVNGVSQGKQSHRAKYRTLESNYRFRWPEVPYEPGELKVVAYDRKENVLGETSIRTAGEPASLELIPFNESMVADGEDMAFVTIRVVDKDGTLCPRASHSLTFSIDGPAELAGLCNGDATSLESFKGTQMKAFNGVCVAYLMSVANSPGVVTLAVSADGLPAASIQIQSNAAKE